MSVIEGLEHQRDACARTGSPLYARLLQAMVDDARSGGLVAELLAGADERVMRDALPLRILGALHRAVLAGTQPDLARFYPSAGGEDGGDPSSAFRAALSEQAAEVRQALQEPVQTNEVGRAAALVGGFVAVAERSGLPLRTLEVGASAGLLSNWDHYAYDTGITTAGDPASPVQFGPGSWTSAPRLEAVEVAERRACDRHPVDVSTETGRRRLQSFVWPDQRERFERLTAALAVAAAFPRRVEEADAGQWIADRLAEPSPGRATVVFHSIVLQYLPRPTFEQLRSSLADAGRRATADAPVAWLRMEPAGPHADVRLTLWPGGDEQILGTTGYHGPPVRWAATSGPTSVG